MKVVAVSQRVDHFPSRVETRDALDQRLIRFLLVAGFLPVPVPNGISKSYPEGTPDEELMGFWLNTVKPQAFVLSGGNDLGQCLERDSTEIFLLEYAFKNKMPLLGICRGMQIIGHWTGVGLEPVDRHIGSRHQILGEITGEVNSYHGFSLQTCPIDFKVISTSEDGEIEAIRHKSLPWEGWMWHPEREEIFANRDIQRINALFS